MMCKLSTMSSRCSKCVFYQRQCVLGHRRPWNAAACDDYRPYCLICNYPQLYCNTCPNLLSRRLKPLSFDRDARLERFQPVVFDCVWSGPSPSA